MKWVRQWCGGWEWPLYSGWENVKCFGHFDTYGNMFSFQRQSYQFCLHKMNFIDPELTDWQATMAVRIRLICSAIAMVRLTS